MRQPAVPYLEPVTAAAWWTTGSAALGGGLSTVVLAAGLGVTGALLVVMHRRNGTAPRLRRGERGRLLRTIGITVALIALSGSVLGYFFLGTLVVPLACVLVGIAAMSLSSVLGERVLVAAGGALLVLGAAGALLALQAGGRMYPVGVVGLTAGAVLWLTAAYRGGLFSARPLRAEAPRQPGAPQFGPLPGPARRGDTRRLPQPGEQDPARWGG